MNYAFYADLTVRLITLIILLTKPVLSSWHGLSHNKNKEPLQNSIGNPKRHSKVDTTGMARCLVLLVCILSTMAQDIPGLEFGDNLAQKYLTQENGVAVVRTAMFKTITFCAWVYPKWSRWRKYILFYTLASILKNFRENLCWHTGDQN